MTFTPKIYTAENLLIMHEYRQAFENGFWIVDSSYTKGYKNTTNSKLPGGRSHLFSKLVLDFSEKDYNKIIKTFKNFYLNRFDFGRKL